MEGKLLMLDWQDKIILVGMVIFMTILALNIDSFYGDTMKTPHKMNLKLISGIRINKMEIKPEDRDTRDSKEANRQTRTSILPNAPPSVKQEFREAQKAMETLINKLREGVKI